MSRIAEFEAQLLDHIKAQHRELRDELIDSGNLDEGMTVQLKEIIKNFKRTFMAGGAEQARPAAANA